MTSGVGMCHLKATWAANSNYHAKTATQSTQAAKHSPAITWTTPAATTYGAALDGTQLNATADVPGTFVYTPAAGKVLSGGTHTLTAKFTPDDADSYDHATATVVLTVNPATPAITWATPASIAYGDDLGGKQLNAKASAGGTLTYSPPAGTILTVGVHTLSVTFSPANAGNFTDGTASVDITVTPATPKITWPKPAAITYGAALDATQLSATANVAGTFVYTPAAGTILPAGTQTLSVVFTPADPNYTTASATVAITVKRATPIVTWATPAPITHGAALGSAQLNATADVAGTFAYSPAAGTKPAAGTRTLSVTFTPTDIGNYTTAKASVTLVVN
jgi:hypothetical protein